MSVRPFFSSWTLSVCQNPFSSENSDLYFFGRETLPSTDLHSPEGQCNKNEVARVGGELLERIEETKTEMIEQTNELISAARDVEPGHLDGAIDFGNTAQAIVVRMGAVLNIHDEKLGMLTESGIRRILEGERGPDWASPREVGSMYDVIRFIADLCGEKQPWIDRAMSTIIDLFKERNGIERLVKHLQVVIENSDEVGSHWERMRSVLVAFPIMNGSTIEGNNFKKYQYFLSLLLTIC